MPSERPGPEPSSNGANDAAHAPDSERPSGVPSEAKSDPPPAEPKRRFDSRLPGLLRRGIEKSIEAGLYTFAKSLETGETVRERIGDVMGEVKIPDVATAVGKALQEARLPREIAGAVLNQFDETKNDVVRIIAREVRDFLEATDLAGEIKAALTSLSFEVRTEVRFIPNDKGTGVRPDVRARGRVKRQASHSSRRRRRDERAQAESASDDDDDDDVE